MPTKPNNSYGTWSQTCSEYTYILILTVCTIASTHTCENGVLLILVLKDFEVLHRGYCKILYLNSWKRRVLVLVLVLTQPEIIPCTCTHTTNLLEVYFSLPTWDTVIAFIVPRSTSAVPYVNMYPFFKHPFYSSTFLLPTPSPQTWNYTWTVYWYSGLAFLWKSHCNFSW